MKHLYSTELSKSMKRIFVPVFLIIMTGSLHSQPYTLQVAIENNEHWWAGVIAEAQLFPLSADSSYQFNFSGNVAGNQGQPLLISDKGRYIWNEKPFDMVLKNGNFTLHSTLSAFQSGTAGKTLRDAYLFCSKKFFPPDGKIPGEELFTKPQFNTWIEFTYNQNQEGILAYARNIVNNGFSPGVLMIDEGWFRNYGDMEFDRTRFPDPKAMMKELKDLGFKVMLWVCPYYSPDGPFWKEQWLKYQQGDTIWIVNADHPEFPAVMQWWDGFSNVIDLSNPKGLSWYKKQLKYLVSEYGVDGFKFDGGDAVHYTPGRFLSRTQTYKRNIIPNEQTELWVMLGLDYPYNEYRAAWKMAGLPIAMRLRDKTHSWTDLRKLIPGIMTQGLMGYSFTCPDMIGGGEYLSFLNLKNVDQELIVRSAECHALMPMMQFSVAPWRVLDRENLNICVNMARLHTDMGRKILELARESAETGEPIVRPLEYQFPGKGYADINDQFMLGSDILVAPVLTKGARSRMVMFPPGKWKGDDGSVVKGPTQKSIEVPLNRLPWYTLLK